MSSVLDRSGDVVNRTGYYTPQVFFVSFVVKQSCLWTDPCEGFGSSTFLFSYPLETTKLKFCLGRLK
jgi:hypothetical protein